MIMTRTVIAKGAAKPARKGSAKVMEEIRNAIFSGAREPGDPILELHVAQQCKVSQTSVREALARLEHAVWCGGSPTAAVS